METIWQLHELSLMILATAAGWEIHLGRFDLARRIALDSNHSSQSCHIPPPRGIMSKPQVFQFKVPDGVKPGEGGGLPTDGGGRKCVTRAVHGAVLCG